MRILFIACISLFSLAAFAQPQYNIDLTNWKLELPTGYSATEWKLSNFEKDRFAKPFFYLDPVDSAFVMEAYPAQGRSTAQYTKNTLREQMKPGSSSVNWTLEQGAVLEADFQVTQMSKDGKKYHKTILFQISGRTTDEQTAQLGFEKNTGPPFLKVFWENGRIRVVRKVLEEWDTVGDALLMKDSWEDDKGKAFRKAIDFNRASIKIVAKEGRIEIHLDEQRPIIFRDTHVKQWYFENYFVVGNYLQSKDKDAHSIVKYYSLNVSHD